MNPINSIIIALNVMGWFIPVTLIVLSYILSISISVKWDNVLIFYIFLALVNTAKAYYK